MVARCSLLTEPWWARASTAGAPREAPDCAMTCAGLRVSVAARGTASGAVTVSAPSRRLDPFLPDLVEPGGEPLGEPAAVGEHEGGGVLGDEVDDALLDVRPDRGALLRPAAAPLRSPVGWPSSAMSGTGTTTLRSHSLVDGRLHDLDRPAAGEVAGDLLDRTDGGGQPDPLGRALEVGVEPLEGEGQVGAALGAGQGVDLVDDDRLDPGERLAGGEVRMRNSDSGVVMSTSVGVRAKARRSSAGVSPERTETVMSGSGTPSRVAACRMPTSGLRRLRSTSTASAFIGET